MGPVGEVDLLPFPISTLGWAHSWLPSLEPPRVASSMTFNPALVLPFFVPLSVCQLCLEGLQPLYLAGWTLESSTSPSFSLLRPPPLRQAGKTYTWHLQAQPSAMALRDYCLHSLLELDAVFQICVVSTAVRLSLWVIDLVHGVTATSSSCVQWSCQAQQIAFCCRHPLFPALTISLF